VQNQYKWPEQQDASGNLEYSAATLPEGSRRQTERSSDGLRTPWFQKDYEVPFLFKRCKNSSELYKRQKPSTVHTRFPFIYVPEQPPEPRPYYCAIP
jgi:hypothetical protein